MQISSLLSSSPFRSLSPLPFTLSSSLNFGPGWRCKQPKISVCLVTSELCCDKFFPPGGGGWWSIFRRRNIERNNVLLYFFVCSAMRILLLGLLKSKWSLVCSSKIVSIKCKIHAVLGHKPSSTNFVIYA
jgi:hypothetical protein